MKYQSNYSDIYYHYKNILLFTSFYIYINCNYFGKNNGMCIFILFINY